MTELLPVDQAHALTGTLLEFLGTTFSLEAPTRNALNEFLTAEDTGIFRGPYVRLRLPFAPAQSNWTELLPAHKEGFTPYNHQVRAFQRLSSAHGHTPEPTMITTGTGSGKTESFLFPILDHAVRAKQRGIRGMKALILYPMNALAQDQARRLAELITQVPAFAGITAALYTGENPQNGRTTVSTSGLITDRATIRREAPDILLTNYKMLDQLLLRHADAALWEQSARSLTYLVIDEFHSYDGAQGTDVAMLLRRLTLAIEAYRGSTEHLPLAGITPVATSATLGDRRDPAAMLGFFETVTGYHVGSGAVVTETRLDYADWAHTAREHTAERKLHPLELDDLVAQDVRAVLESIQSHAQGDVGTGIATDPGRAARLVLSRLYHTESEEHPVLTDCSDADLLELAAAHPLTEMIAGAAQKAIPIAELTEIIFGSHLRRAADAGVADLFTGIYLSVLSHLRAVCGRNALTIDVNLWIRELTRIDRIVSPDTPAFHWADDGPIEQAVLPAIYCRNCGRSGWGVLLEPTGLGLARNDRAIRGEHARGSERFRPLIFAPGEAEMPGDDAPAPLWLDMASRMLRADTDTVESSLLVPVLTHTGDDAGKDSKNDVCPACGARDSIRFLGSAIATQLSVALSSLLSTPGMNGRERKALVFTDSVQDAAHRAGFVQARSYSLTLRALMRQALDEGPATLTELTQRMLTAAGSDSHRRYALLPPELAQIPNFRRFWEQPGRHDRRTLARVTTRLSFDVQLEFGLRSSTGRTLEASTSAVVGYDIADAILIAAARDVLQQANQSTLDGRAFFGGAEPTESELLRWAIGFLHRMRIRGAISHNWWKKFRTKDGNRWWITGGRKRNDGMPGFGHGNSAPGFPVIGARERIGEDLEPVGSPAGWYAMWTAKALHVSRPEGASLANALMRRLEAREVVEALPSESRHTTYALPPDLLLAEPVTDAMLTGEPIALRCTVCDAVVHGSPRTIRSLSGGPCLMGRCAGTLERTVPGDNFYRRMYASHGARRVVAREHTSLLEPQLRLQYEQAFKASDPPADAPNVLVATPTLEMGIDIGDLSAAMLASLPKSVASYLQRVGRAGRLTGNSLVLSFVTARGDQLRRFAHPEETINGAVRPPATYLNALEILKRQYLAAAADALSRESSAFDPRKAGAILDPSSHAHLLEQLIAKTEEPATLASFLEVFSRGATAAHLRPDTIHSLQDWAMPHNSTSGVAQRCYQAAAKWKARLQSLTHAEGEITKAIPELEVRAKSPSASSEDKQASRSAAANRRHVVSQIATQRDQHWISAMEEYGLFPNYTLMDDSVTLDAQLSFMNPETQDYETEELEVGRSSAIALQDFAPGNTFYTHGYGIAIDAVDLGRDNENIHQWACCAQCGYVADLGVQGSELRPPAVCPRCGADGLDGAAQRVAVVELDRVSAVSRRDDALIDDRAEERQHRAFTTVTLADIDPATSNSWFVDGTEFGVRYSREVVMRWINTGPSASRGPSLNVANQLVPVPAFRLCAHCGKLDTDSGQNTPREHRPWCPQRTALKEDNVAITLGRHLATEGLLLRIPRSITVGEDFALPSLTAALFLALREHLGGDPDHLRVVAAPDPSPTSPSNPPGLLIYDTVPGGTGYLAELAEPTTLWEILKKAYNVLSTCSCQDTGALACEKCLLPFAPPSDVNHVSRAVAARSLARILTIEQDHDSLGTNDLPWSHITHDDPGEMSIESYLEQQFRAVLKDRFTHEGGTVQERPGPDGTIINLTTPQHEPMRVDPQVNIAGSRPDFVVTFADAARAPVAIFTDGRAFHFSPACNRVKDDAEKREALRARGYAVISLTAADLVPHQERFSPPWYNPAVTDAIMADGTSGLSRTTYELCEDSELDLLLEFIRNRNTTSAIEKLGQWLPLYFFSAQSELISVGANVDLAEIARAAIDGKDLSSYAGPMPAAVWLHGTVAVVTRQHEDGVRFDFAAMLDDRDEAVSEQNVDSWRIWLHLMNLLTLRTDPTAITTYTSSAGPIDIPVTTREAALADLTWQPEGGLSIAWKETLAEAQPEERHILEELLRQRGSAIPLPTLGWEVGDGIPLSIAWPDFKISVAWPGITSQDEEEIAAAGWTTIPADTDAIVHALKDAGGI